MALDWMTFKALPTQSLHPESRGPNWTRQAIDAYSALLSEVRGGGGGGGYGISPELYTEGHSFITSDCDTTM